MNLPHFPLDPFLEPHAGEIERARRQRRPGFWIHFTVTYVVALAATLAVCAGS